MTNENIVEDFLNSDTTNKITPTEIEIKVSAVNTKKSVKARSQQAMEVDSFLSELDVLASENDDYEKKFVAGGNKAAHKLISKMYDLALRIDHSDYREKTINALRKALKDNHNIKTTVKTPWMTVIVKCVVKANRQTCSNYSKVMQIAFDNGVNSTDLIGYIEKNKGTSNIISEHNKKNSKKPPAEERKARREAILKYLTAKACHEEVIVDRPQDILFIPNKNDKKCGVIDFALTYDFGANQVHVYNIKFGSDFEEKIFDHIQSNISTDTEELKSLADKHYSLVMDKIHKKDEDRKRFSKFFEVA